MVRLIAILAGLSCVMLSGCKDHVEDQTGKAGAGINLHGTNPELKEGTPCLVNLSGSLSACSPFHIGQQRLVLIRNVVLPADE